MNTHLTTRRSSARQLALRAGTVAALVGAVALAACSREGDNRTAGEKLDSAVATAQQKTEQMKDSVERGAEKTQDAGRDAANKASMAIDDASITTKVNAELAKDPTLSAMKIDVDTDAGRVALKGTAPDAAAKDRATQLALAVQGVLAVDNQLKVEGKM